MDSMDANETAKKILTLADFSEHLSVDYSGEFLECTGDDLKLLARAFLASERLAEVAQDSLKARVVIECDDWNADHNQDHSCRDCEARSALSAVESALTEYRLAMKGEAR